MDKKIDLSVVLPAYREGSNLALLLPRIRELCDSLKISYEIIVVDTAQPLDETPDLCRKANVRYINRRPANSFGDAVRTGIATLSGRWALFMDADGSHSPEFIAKLWNETLKTPLPDVVIASRYIQGGDTENSQTLIWMSRVLNWTYLLVLGLKCKDVSNSFKVYRAADLKALTLKCENFDIIEEILFKIVRRQPWTRIVEIPFSFKKRMFGETKRNLFAFILTYVFTMIRLRLSVVGSSSKNPVQ